MISTRLFIIITVIVMLFFSSWSTIYKEETKKYNVSIKKIKLCDSDDEVDKLFEECKTSRDLIDNYPLFQSIKIVLTYWFFDLILGTIKSIVQSWITFVFLSVFSIIFFNQALNYLFAMLEKSKVKRLLQHKDENSFYEYKRSKNHGKIQQLDE